MTEKTTIRGTVIQIINPRFSSWFSVGEDVYLCEYFTGSWYWENDKGNIASHGKDIKVDLDKISDTEKEMYLMLYPELEGFLL